jgi:hypothetical protein
MRGRAAQEEEGWGSERRGGKKMTVEVLDAMKQGEDRVCMYG